MLRFQWGMFLLFLVLPFLYFASVSAQIYKDSEISLPFITGSGVILDFSNNPPIGPNLLVVPFQNALPPQNLSERVSRLAQGITIDIPPEIDVYGYEIRRYMQGVGDIRIYTDNEYLREQYVNVKKANVILDYWREALKKEIQELDEIMKQQDIPLTTRTEYKQNSAAVRNFLSVSRQWIDGNLKLLQYLDSMDGRYEFEYPNINFKIEAQAKKFYKLMKTKQEALIEVRKYTIFRLMVY